MCWLEKLQQTLTRIRVSKSQLRIAILGVGHELRGDDALGIVAVRKLMQEPPAPVRGLFELLCIDAGPVPENFCSVLRDFQPGLFLVIDAAHLEQPPGTIAWIDPAEVDDSSFSTHSLPLSVILNYLAAEAGCEAAILGVQPACLTFGAPLSSEVCQAVDSLVHSLQAAFQAQVETSNLSNVFIA